MNDLAVKFLEENFKKIKLLYNSNKSEIWLIENKDGIFYVRKDISLGNISYRCLKEIRHPILPQNFYVVENAQKTIVIEEFINGKTLAERLKEGPLEEGIVIDMALQLCDGLAILHNHGIIHRDIKPENIMLSNEQVKLIDFDAARIYKPDSNQDTMYLGTPRYAAPEQLFGEQTDSRSDIFSLGKMLQVLLGNNYAGPLLVIIKKCTTIERNKRYQTIGELVKALKHLHEPQRKKAQRSRAIIAMFTSLTLLTGCYWLWRHVQDEKSVEVLEKQLQPESPQEHPDASPNPPQQEIAPPLDEPSAIPNESIPKQTVIPLMENTPDSTSLEAFTKTRQWLLEGEGWEVRLGRKYVYLSGFGKRATAYSPHREAA